ncbi:MAG: ABC transporter, partial [Actinobacteria bacterium]|nr:ABC transporter [Actinomycetota bacterium]
MSEKILEVKNLSFSYDGTEVISDLDFKVYKGDF